jgi:TatD DNase family protein
MPLIDTHLHLDEEAFRPDRDEVVARASAEAVATMITIGINAGTSRAAVALTQTYPTVFAAVAIQPNYVSQAAPGDWETIEELATQPKVVAVGETGLDRYWDHAPFDMQVEFFDKHLELARRLDLPFIVHCREAESDVVAQLRRFAAGGALRGVMHSFSGDLPTALACVELGMFISFAGMLTFKKNDALRSVAAQVPLDRLLVETDAPYLAPTPFRGKRNEPAYVRHTVEVLASVRNLTRDEIAQITTDNARRLFKLPNTGAQ